MCRRPAAEQGARAGGRSEQCVEGQQCSSAGGLALTQTAGPARPDGCGLLTRGSRTFSRPKPAFRKGSCRGAQAGSVLTAPKGPPNLRDFRKTPGVSDQPQDQEVQRVWIQKPCPGLTDPSTGVRDVSEVTSLVKLSSHPIAQTDRYPFPGGQHLCPRGHCRALSRHH